MTWLLALAAAVAYAVPAAAAGRLGAAAARNALLVAAEGAGRALPGWAHETLGLVVLGNSSFRAKTQPHDESR